MNLCMNLWIYEVYEFIRSSLKGIQSCLIAVVAMENHIQTLEGDGVYCGLICFGANFVPTTAQMDGNLQKRLIMNTWQWRIQDFP